MKKTKLKKTQYESSLTLKMVALPTPEEIGRRAHEIFLLRGGAPGRELEDWLLAEHELKRERSKE